MDLFLSSCSQDIIIPYSIKLIGALSSHPKGCHFIADNELSSLFSQIFLLQSQKDKSICLFILTHLCQAFIEIS
jgi:hypothetical protein